MTCTACGHPTGDHDYRGCEVFVPANDGRCRCPHPNDDATPRVCFDRETCTSLHTGDLINGAGEEADHHYGCECPLCLAVYASLR
ncbi:MAG TPA: hypothetical protein VEA38_13835 [Terriglobales bacterium]|nr:hypothetical protein [Terriglobales bacterium]